MVDHDTVMSYYGGMKNITVRVIDPTAFKAAVFGADCFLENFPEILTTGVEVLKHDDRWYIHKDGKPVDGVWSFAASTCFFSEDEMEFLEVVK